MSVSPSSGPPSPGPPAGASRTSWLGESCLGGCLLVVVGTVVVAVLIAVSGPLLQVLLFSGAVALALKAIVFAVWGASNALGRDRER